MSAILAVRLHRYLAIAMVGALVACEGPPDSLDVLPRAPSAVSGPAYILLIGDGMGAGELQAASYYRHGAPERLVMQALPVRGTLRTSSPTGITDSAAAGTVMSTGVFTDNGKIALTREDKSATTLIEQAHLMDLWTGVVTTTTLNHATPASFAAHEPSRNDYDAIASDMGRDVRPTVMLGGGRNDFHPDVRGGQYSSTWPGYRIVQDSFELADVPSSHRPGDRVLGLFADSHLPYVRERKDDPSVPTLPDMTRAALAILEQSPHGFFLMVEGGRIDHAGHSNLLEDNIMETLEFDDTVAAVVDWAHRRSDVTMLVTADHETGGLEVLQPMGVGQLPVARWRSDYHTNDLIEVFGRGPLSYAFSNRTADHRLIHWALTSLITGTTLEQPSSVTLADGSFADLGRVAGSEPDNTQVEAGLSGIYLSRSDQGLGIGIEGVFPWANSSLVVLVDIDYGASTGVYDLASQLDDLDGGADALLSRLHWSDFPEIGVGWDYAVVSMNGADPQSTSDADNGGLRDLRGDPQALPHIGIATNYFNATRVYGPARIQEGKGFETLIPWSAIGEVAAHDLAITALLVNSAGEVTQQLHFRPPLKSANTP